MFYVIILNHLSANHARHKNTFLHYSKAKPQVREIEFIERTMIFISRPLEIGWHSLFVCLPWIPCNIHLIV